MQKLLITGFIISLLISSISCRKNFDTIPGEGNFSVEKDTVFLDSVFSNISSRTYRFKIYNNDNQDINLNKIYLENGEQSFYRLNVDGDAGKSFENVMIHAHDSLFVFVEVTADIHRLSGPVYEEKLLIEDNVKTESVLLTSFVKDAYFFYPERFPDGTKETLTLYTDPETGESTEIYGFFLDGDTTFTNEKPIVIYGHMAVPSGHTLNIEEGTHLYFHHNSGLIVWEDASLKVNGSLGNEVIFEDDRMEAEFENTPGMWNYIWLRENSKENEINYAIIKNAEAGIIAYPSNDSDPVLEIKNTQIYNMSLVGIYGLATGIEAENLVMNNFGLSAVNLQLGGNYIFRHCTFANYSNGIRNEKSGAVYVNNFLKTDEQIYVNDLENFEMSNSIVYGNSSIEFFLEKNENAEFNYSIYNSLIKFNDSQNNYSGFQEVDFTDEEHYENIILNEDPVFKNPQENELIIGNTSPCINQGDCFTSLMVPYDILGKDRTIEPDLGAYQHTDFDEE